MSTVIPTRLERRMDAANHCHDGPMKTITPCRYGITIAKELLPISILLCVVLLGGCNQLRLPAIDPTGSCLFAPFPTTTTLALPGHNGQPCGCFSCLNKLGSCLKNPSIALPEPAFPEPVDPPACATPGDGQHGLGSCFGKRRDEPCVPSQPCDGSCSTGPRAVLLGSEIDEDCPLHLPERGKRGCILLSPQRIVAPVGGEVVLLSGICGDDGYLQVNEPLEWMLTNDSVGTILQVGDDEPGVLHKLVGANRPDKRSGSYAIGVTSSKPTLITRGNVNPRDDVKLEKGQTWVTLSSPSEGTSRITVLAPESECWDQRKATATIYWIDARWQFPGPQRVPAGTPVELSTRVTRSEGTLPARGWRVRYEILQPALATFAGTNGSSVVEANVDENGNAVAGLVPTPGTSGTAMINMQVIRPGGDSDNMPTMTIGSGQTIVTWSSPQLALRAGAPSIATYDVPTEVVINVSNPGDQPAENVKVNMQFPAGARVTADSFAQVFTNSVQWDVGTVPPQTQLDLFMTIALQAPAQMPVEARADGGLFAEDLVRIDVYRPSLSIAVSPERERYETGQPVKFSIAVRNTGDRPLSNVRLEAFGDGSMLHSESNSQQIENLKSDGPLQPGATWNTSVTFLPTNSGRRCINVQAFADGGQRTTADSCVTVINPIPPTPAVTATLDGRPQTVTGAVVLYKARIANTGEVPLRNVRVTMAFDPQLRLIAATEGADQTRVSQYLVAWTIPTLAPGASEILEGQFEAISPNPRSQIVLTVASAEGASASDDFVTEILQGAPPAAAPAPAPSLPPALAPPSIPGGPAPGSTQPSAPQGSAAPQTPAPAAPVQPAGALRLSLVNRDNPAAVGQAIRYALRVTNASNQPDSQVRVQFNLPSGVNVERVNQTRSPELGQFQSSAGVVYLTEIRSMRPGESIDYDIVLRSNQPQTFDLVVDAVSRLMPSGVSTSASTRVLP